MFRNIPIYKSIIYNQNNNLPAPIALSATNVDFLAFDANWIAEEGLTYKLWVSTKEYFDTILPDYNGITVSGGNYTVNVTDPGRNYYYRLKSLSGSEESDYSYTTTVVTNATSMDYFNIVGKQLIDFYPTGITGNLTEVTEVYIPFRVPSGDILISIADDAFALSTNITLLHIHSAVKSIGNNAIYNCTSLTSVTVINCGVEYGNSVFENCTSLSTFDFCNGIQEIGIDMFKNCSFAEIDITANSLTAINLGAWSGNPLTHITIKTGFEQLNDLIGTDSFGNADFSFDYYQNNYAGGLYVYDEGESIWILQ